MITIKLKLQNEIEIGEYQKQFSILVRYFYNRIRENNTIKQADAILLSQKLNGIELDVSWRESAFRKALQIYHSQVERKDKTVIFGGKKNFSDYSNGKITREEYKQQRILSMYCIGKCSDLCGNRKFELKLSENKVIFKPDRKHHFDAILPRLSKNQKSLLSQIEEKARLHQSPITYQISKSHVYIIFDEKYCQQSHKKVIPKSNRILSIDSNPNYLGITICDYKNDKQKVIHKEILSNKRINDINTRGLSSKDKKNIYKNNKRNHEISEIAQYISKLAESKHCEFVAIEKLSIPSKDNKNGRKYNKLVNNMWNRNKLFNVLRKWSTIKNIRVLEIEPAYSSFIGCINHENEIDSIAASLEINRRCYCFVTTFIKKTCNKTGNIIYPRIVRKKILNKWKDEGLTAKDLANWISLYNWFKSKPTLSYRFLLDPCGQDGFRLFSHKSMILKYIIL